MLDSSKGLLAQSILLLTCASISISTSALPRSVARAEPPARSKRPAIAVEEVALLLSSSTGDEVRLGLESVPETDLKAITPTLVERMRSGLPHDLLLIAMEVLSPSKTADRDSMFVELAAHRRPTVRARACQNLQDAKGDAAVSALSRGLGDEAREVREAAAQSLAAADARKALPALKLAFERDVEFAAEALGQLARSEDLPSLLAYLQRLPLTSATPMLEEMLGNDHLSVADKASVVESVRALGTAEARGYLEGALKRLPAAAPPKLRRALADALNAMKQ